MPGPGRPGGGHNRNGKPKKAKNFKTATKRLFKEMKIIRTQLIIVCLLLVVSVSLSIFIPKLTGWATDAIFPSLNVTEAGRLLLIAGALYVLSAIIRTTAKYIMAGATQKMVYSLRKRMRENLSKAPISYYDTNSTGDLISRLTNDLDRIGQNLQQSINQIIMGVFTIIGVLIMMFTINVTLTFIVLLILPLSVVIAGFIVSKSQTHFTKQAKYLGKVTSHIEETYSGQKIVKAFNMEEYLQNELKEINEELYQSGRKANFISGLMFPIINSMNNLSYVIVTIICSIFISNGKLSFGDLIVFLQYSQQFTRPVAQMAQLSSIIQTLIASSERVFEVIDAKPEIADADNAIQLNDINGQIKFNDVKFGYSKNKVLMNSVNINTKPGQVIALVGPTGAGKTTIVNLIMRFYELNSGNITIDGHSITDIKRENLRKNIGMVLQDTWLFNGTIKENIAYGNPKATDKEIIKASKQAQAHHFIQTLPDGYDTVINETASNISQGQKQLLTIARALLASPKIIILDEATSSVDTRTELLIQEAMEEIMKGRTSFVIAHRLSTIVNADKILVMNNGNIIEQGTHSELLKKKGFYEKLYNSQFA